MEDRKDKQILQQVFESSLSGIQEDPWMAQRVLHQAHEAHGTGGFVVKKKISLAMILLIIGLFLSCTVALAAIISNTAERFGDLYGEDWTNAALRGSDIDTSKPSIRVGDVAYSMDDVIITGIEQEEGSLTEDDNLCTRILATGTMRPAEGANVVLMPEDYLTSDPWNFDPYYNGHANVPEGTTSVLERASETDAKILCTHAVGNGLMDSKGNLYSCDIAYADILQEDGSVMFLLEIGLFDPIPRQESYTLSVYVANHQVTSGNEHLMDTRVSEDWVFTIHPRPSESQLTVASSTVAPQAASPQPAAQTALIDTADGVLFANWEDTVRPLLEVPVVVSVTDPRTNTVWQMHAAVAENGNYADAKPVSDADVDAMVCALGSVMSPQAVFVTFPNGQTCLGTLGSRGYERDEDVDYGEDGTALVVEEDGSVIVLKQVAYIHFPRSAHHLDPSGYGAAHQNALTQAWEQLQER